jgi:hypothetical protein
MNVEGLWFGGFFLALVGVGIFLLVMGISCWPHKRPRGFDLDTLDKAPPKKGR